MAQLFAAQKNYHHSAQPTLFIKLGWTELVHQGEGKLGERKKRILLQSSYINTLMRLLIRSFLFTEYLVLTENRPDD